MSVSLSQKAIILVALPLACEVIFVATLSGLLYQVQNERQRENHAREVSTHVNGALVALLDRLSSCVLYKLSHSKAFRYRFDNDHKKLKEELLIINDLVKNNVEEKNSINQMMSLFVSCGNDLQEANDQMAIGGKAEAAAAWLKADQGMQDLLDAIDVVILKEENILKERRAAQEKYIVFVEGTLLFGVIFNVALASALVVYFNQGTSSRLKKLMDNTVRLAVDKPLNEPLTGSDEIAHLDRTFREMADALEESRRKERAVVDNAADIICTIDRLGVIEEINPAVETLWGYTADDVTGRSLNRVVHPEDWKATLQSIENIVAAAAAEGTFENRIIGKDQRISHFAWSAHWSAREKSLFCVARDISAQKEIDQMKRDFVAMVSHDLRTPLSSIQMVLSLVAAEAYGQINDNGHEKLQAAEESADRLLAMVNELLDLEKMESGKLELNREKCSLQALIKSSMSATAGLAAEQKIRLVGPQNLPSEIIAFIDPDRITQVLINLLSNAVKFSPPGESVSVSLEQSNNEVKVSIIDKGRGVPVHLREAIFDRFKQAQASDARIKKGSGLGLAICKAIIEQHDGKIGVESQEGQGSVFWFILPRGC